MLALESGEFFINALFAFQVGEFSIQTVGDLVDFPKGRQFIFKIGQFIFQAVELGLRATKSRDSGPEKLAVNSPKRLRLQG